MCNVTTAELIGNIYRSNFSSSILTDNKSLMHFVCFNDVWLLCRAVLSDYEIRFHEHYKSVWILNIQLAARHSEHK